MTNQTSRRILEGEDHNPTVPPSAPVVPEVDNNPTTTPAPAPAPGPDPISAETVPTGAAAPVKSLAEAEAEGSLDDRMTAVRAAVSKRYNEGPGEYCYTQAIFDDRVIVQKGAKLYEIGYTVADDGAVTLGETPKEVKITYAATEGAILGPVGDDGRMLEAGATVTGKKWGVLIIQEGMSKNRNRYGRKVLTEAAPLYESAKIYMDHEETPRRFGRSTRDVAGFLKNVRPVVLGTKEAEGGVLALAATAVIVSPTVQGMLLDAYNEGNPDLFGLSHDVKAESVTAVGPDGPFYEVKRIDSVSSVDFVTNPAAGGRLLRIVASDRKPDTLDKDGNMLKKLIEAIQASGNAELIAKLKALGDTPDEDQVLAIHREALAAKPAPVPAPTPAAVPVQDGPKVVQVTEADWIEVRRDGLNLFLENTLGGVTLPDPVKASIRKRFSEAITAGAFPAKDAITAAVKEQVDIFAALADKGFTMPGQQMRTELGKGPAENAKEALDAFFDPKKPATSFREIYVQITGDTKITGRVQDAPRLKEALNTGSWTEILGDSITRRMVADYQANPLTNWRGVIADVVPVNDFRTQRRMRFGGYGNLPTVGQGAPYTALTSPTDEEATYAPAKRGGTESVTMEMITNDDVGAVRRIPGKLARAAAQTLHEFVWGFLNANGLIYDGVALAAGGHNNLIATALTATNLGAARLLLKKQTDMNSGKRIGLAARYLIVPTDLEELAYQLTASMQMLPDAGLSTTASPAAKNFLATQGIRPITVDYWTDLDNYWVTADPTQAPMIEIGFLSGREEPELFVQDTPNQGSLFSNDQITYKIRHTYGGGVLDYRAFVGGIVP
jgi:hypothetical protein